MKFTKPLDKDNSNSFQKCGNEFFPKGFGPAGHKGFDYQAFGPAGDDYQGFGPTGGKGNGQKWRDGQKGKGYGQQGQNNGQKGYTRNKDNYQGFGAGVG